MLLNLPLRLALLSMLATSCDYLRSTSRPCQEDKFFCNEPHKQKALLKTIDDASLLRVSRLNYEYFHPPSGDFAREISRRGDSGIIILRYLSVENEVDVELFRDVASSYLLTYNVDLCGPSDDSNLEKMCKSI